MFMVYNYFQSFIKSNLDKLTKNTLCIINNKIQLEADEVIFLNLVGQIRQSSWIDKANIEKYII